MNQTDKDLRIRVKNLTCAKQFFFVKGLRQDAGKLINNGHWTNEMHELQERLEMATKFTLIKQDIKVVLTALKTTTNDGLELQDDRQIPWMQ